MYSILIAFVTGLIVAGVAHLAKLSNTWVIICGLLGFLAVVIVISQIIRLRIKQIQLNLQKLMEEIQHKLMMKQNQFMRKPVGSPKTMMQILEKEQAAGIRQAIEACDAYTPYYRWSFMLDKQVNTMKMAFHYQLKEYDKVDELLKRCLLFDAQSISMKIARMYMLKEEGIDKYFKKKCRSLKDPACVLPYSLYAWILVKQERYEDALKLLVDAKKKTDNEVIMKNWEALANNKYKSFSNAGIGEMWYALGLEEMKMPKQQQAYRYR